MAQGIILRIRISERYILKLHIIIIIQPFFHCERSLVHIIWDIKIRKITFQIIVVGTQPLQGTDKPGNRFQQKHNAGDIFRDRTDRNRP